jgi:glyoxylase-like metal-dependent hydrolase (beta-lactamase superfamily II)/GAF domain-containing protein
MRSDQAWLKPELIDSDKPFEIADRLWWVGHYQVDDVFQCHVYLLEQGDQSVLFDPGSRLTFRHTLRKIEQVIPFSKIRYFVCHHQDPDITGALDLIDAMVSRDDAVIVTHWRAAVLLKHYALSLPFWQVEDHGWQLPLEDRTLKFVFTPYAHFPGAFCSFDDASGTLMSSDLFGGFTEAFQLYAPDESYFEQMRPFHEHYIPGRDILLHALSQVEQHPVVQIAPQHGSIIPPPLVKFMIARLKELDCGLYLMAEVSTEVLRMSRLNKLLQGVTQALIVNRKFADVVRAIRESTQAMLPTVSWCFWSRDGEGQVLHLAEQNRYRGVVVEPEPAIAAIFAASYDGVPAARPLELNGMPCFARPLLNDAGTECTGLFVVRLGEPRPLTREIEEVLDRVADPISVALAREAVHRMLALSRQELFARATRDPLTGLYTRLYLNEAIGRQFALADRHTDVNLTLLMLDLDFFKSVNDTYGHLAGDDVLAAVGKAILEGVRDGDLPVSGR